MPSPHATDRSISAGSTRSRTQTATRFHQRVSNMTNRTLAGIALAAALLSAASAALAQVPARVPQRGTAEQLQQLASKPTPKLADGRVDFNGTWDHLGGIDFVRPQTRADGSVCFIGCPPPAGAARGAAQGARPGGPPPAPFPPV